MAEDAPKIPDAPKAPGPRKVTSLTEIVEAAQKSPPKPEPIVLEWFLPPTTEEPLGTVMQMTIETRFSADPWLFGIKYMTEVQEQKRLQEPDDKGVLVNKHPDADVVALAKEIVVSPTWLHNEAAVAKFKSNVPPTTFSELRRRMMLVAGLNGDFFADYQELTVPRAWMASVSASPKGLASPPGPLTTSPPTTSSPGSTTTDSADKKPAVNGLETNSGSSPSTPTIVQPA